VTIGPDGQPGQGTPGSPDGQPYPVRNRIRRFHDSAKRAGDAFSRFSDPRGAQPGSFRAGGPVSGNAGPPVNSQTAASRPRRIRRRPVSGPVAYFGHRVCKGQRGAAGRREDDQRSPDETQPARTCGVQATSNLMGGGIAACEHSGKRLNYDLLRRSMYNEWEFVYDPTKERPLPNPAGGERSVRPRPRWARVHSPPARPRRAGRRCRRDNAGNNAGAQAVGCSLAGYPLGPP